MKTATDAIAATEAFSTGADLNKPTTHTYMKTAFNTLNTIFGGMNGFLDNLVKYEIEYEPETPTTTPSTTGGRSSQQQAATSQNY